MRRARALSAEEAALWARVAATVAPIRNTVPGTATFHETAGQGPAVSPPKRLRGRMPPPLPVPEPVAPSARPLDRHGLDAGWDRRLAKGLIAPDFTLDLHGHSLDAAWSRLDHGLALAAAQQARVVLVITGRPRPAPAADRGGQRGAIRAKIVDWLAAGGHASRIAAVRPAHPRHGGAGALYVVLRRPR